jgi:PelA/Pel-15E family pectate lyase
MNSTIVHFENMFSGRTARSNIARAIAAVACLLVVRSLAAAEPISIDGLGDGIRHWKNGSGTDGYPAYEPGQVQEIADNLLRYQRANGGWPKDFDPLRILSEEELKNLAADRGREDTTFDNRATYTVVEYLAAAYKQTGDARYRDAALSGLDFILRAQYANGGWPHSYPSTKGYYPHITIVDDVMVGVLSTLGRVAAGTHPFDFIDEPLRSRATEALARGQRCLLRLQVVVDGQLTAWAPQYDSVTLEPAQGRTFEPPALVSSESVGVLRYLMRLDNPSAEVRTAIQAGVDWLERSKIVGLRIERVPAETIRYRNHTSRDDLVVVEDPQAAPIWARFYEIDTNRPFMANRDGKKVFRLADVERERRTGYSWYGAYATGLLTRENPAWCRKWMVEP